MKLKREIFLVASLYLVKGNDWIHRCRCPPGLPPSQPVQAPLIVIKFGWALHTQKKKNSLGSYTCFFSAHVILSHHFITVLLIFTYASPTSSNFFFLFLFIQQVDLPFQIRIFIGVIETCCITNVIFLISELKGEISLIICWINRIRFECRDPGLIRLLVEFI